MIYIHYWLLFSKNDNFKYPTASQRLTFNSFSLFYIFFISSFSFLLSLFKLSCTKKHHVYNLYRISYSLSFWYLMYYIVLEICIGGHFLEDCFNCYLQQIKSVVANESLIPYNLIKRAPYFFWVENCYLLTWNLAHILSNLKTFKEAINAFWMWREIFYWSHILAFSADSLPFTCFG